MKDVGDIELSPELDEKIQRATEAADAEIGKRAASISKVDINLRGDDSQ
jgi:hypothetical protein